LCREDGNCKKRACRFTHLSLKDFPNLHQQTRPVRSQRRLNQRK
jgi:hypothetical protein